MNAPQARAPVTPRARSARDGHGFGTMPVFLAAISTILGAVMFLRFGYAVGNLGLVARSPRTLTREGAAEAAASLPAN